MAYKIKYNGYEVECDTASDLRALLNQSDDKPQATGSKTNGANGNRHERTEHKETPSPVSGLIAKLRAEQRQLLKIVATQGTISRDDLFQAVGISDPHVFAGLLIGISKSAAGSGIESPIEKIMDRFNGRGARVYRYKIRDNVKTEVKAALVQ